LLILLVALFIVWLGAWTAECPHCFVGEDYTRKDFFEGATIYTIILVVFG
jgi:hypothetical protein